MTYPLRDYVQPSLDWMAARIEEDNPSVEFNIEYADSKCSDEGMIEILTNNNWTKRKKQFDAMLGPVCAPAARQALLYGKVHDMTVITPGATAAHFNDKYPE